MKIYTKTGDGGETGLFGGPRVAKDDVRVEALAGLHGLPAVRRLSHDLDVLGRAEERSHTLPEDGVVVGYEHPDLRHVQTV